MNKFVKRTLGTVLLIFVSTTEPLRRRNGSVVEPKINKRVIQGSIPVMSSVPARDIICDVILSSAKLIVSVAFRVRKGVCDRNE
jgi:hypothetical protein